jgi:putative transposase
VTLAELEVLLAEAIALYHITPHGGLMSRQPLLVWEKELARQNIDLIWDEGEFRRSIGAVEYDRSLDGAGISFKGLSYTDKVLTRALLDDLAALEPRRRPTKNPTAKVKFKYDPSDLGCIHVWNRRTLRYVTLPCTQPAYAEGLPVWLHERVQEFAKAEALAFNTLDERLDARENLSALIHEIAPQARQREKRILAKLMEAKERKGMPLGSIETKKVFASPSGMESIVPFDLAAPHRVDAEVAPPRPRRGQEDQQRDRRDAGSARHKAKGSMKRGRDAGSAPERPAPQKKVKKTGTGSSWGDVYE